MTRCAPRTRPNSGEVTQTPTTAVNGRVRAARERSVAYAMTPATRRIARLSATALFLTSSLASVLHLGGVLDLGLGSMAAPLGVLASVVALASLGRVGVFHQEEHGE